MLAAVLTACASTSAEPAFRDTARLVEQRSGRRVTWNRGGSEDAAVALRVRALLATELTVPAAVEIALLSNPALQATYEDLSIGQADLVQAGLLQNPSLGAGIAFPVAGSATTGVGVSISQDFLGIFTLAARKKLARIELRATELRVGDVVLRTAFEVEEAYYRLAAAEQARDLRRTLLAIAEATTTLARAQHDAGNINDLDLASQEAALEQLVADGVRTDAAVVVAEESLARLLAVSGEVLERLLPAKLPPLPPSEPAPENLEAIALGRRLDVAAVREDEAAGAQALGLATRFRWLGGTSVGATYDHSPEGFTTVGPTVGLEVPIFDQKQATIARLAARVRAARARTTAVEQTARSEARVAWSRLTATRTVALRYANVVVPLRERIVSLAQEQYNAMLLGTPQLLQAKQAELTADLELIEAVRDYWIARADLERVTGGAFGSPPPPPVAGADKGP